MVFGYLQTTFAVVQLCGGPLFGRYNINIINMLIAMKRQMEA